MELKGQPGRLLIMGPHLFKRTISILFACILLTACSDQTVYSVTLTQTVTTIITPEIAAPILTPTLTSLPAKTAFPGIPSVQPTLKPPAPVREIHARINWSLKTKFLAQATSFIDLQHGWAAAETELVQTINGGQTWLKVSITPDIFSRINFVSSTHGWGMGKDWLYVTKDGGKTWERQVQKNFTTGSGIWKPAIEFINDQVGWLTINSEVSKTMDGGQSWQKANIPQIESKYADPSYSISFTTPEKGWILRAHCSMPACLLILYKTQDGGKTWQEITRSGTGNPSEALPGMRPPDEIFFLDDQYGWFVGSMGSDYATEDGGKTWKPFQYLGGAGPSMHQIHMFTPLQGIADYWMGGFNAVVRTDDGGKTWSEILPALYPKMNIQFFSLANGVGLNNDDHSTKLLATKNGGDSWQKVGEFPCNTQFLNEKSGWGVCFFNPSNVISGELYHTSDGGSSWQLIPTPDSLVTLDGRFMDDQTGVVWDHWDHLFGTQDGGKTWQPVQVYQNKFPLRDNQSGWLTAGDKIIYHASPAESTWVQVFPIGYITQFDPVSDDVAFVSYNSYGEFLKTVDGGKTWARILMDDMIDGNNYFHFNFVDAQHGWLASNQGLFRTTDGGLTWDQIQQKVGY